MFVDLRTFHAQIYKSINGNFILQLTVHTQHAQGMVIVWRDCASVKKDGKA